jgi:glycosyltransferase involved in cell wall biosynthesis
MKHLAIFLPSLDGGGAERVILALAERFVALGIRCDLVIAIEKGKLLNETPDGIRLISLNKEKTITSVFSLAKYIRTEQPDTILSAIFTANLCAILAAKIARKGTRIVTSEVSPTSFDMATSSRWTTTVNKTAAKILYPFADNIIAVSKGIRSSILESKLARPSRVRVIYNPIISQECPQSNASDMANKTIVACGRLEAQKDYPTLLRSFRLVRNERNVKLLILGEGSLRSELEATVDKLGLSEDVIFTEFVPCPLQYMKNAAVFVHTAAYEGFGVVLLEALTAGCPIVATDSPGGVREVLANGKFGTLVPVGDNEAIAKAILDILDGRKIFSDPVDHLKQFDINCISESYLKVLFPDA